MLSSGAQADHDGSLYHSLAIWRELDVPNRLLEVEVVQNGRSLEIDEDSAAI